MLSKHNWTRGSQDTQEAACPFLPEKQEAVKSFSCVHNLNSAHPWRHPQPGWAEPGRETALGAADKGPLQTACRSAY